MGFGGVDLGIDIPGLELFRVDDGHIQGPAHEAGHGDAGALCGEDLGDLLALEALGQGGARLLNQIHVHAVVEEHIHPDDIALAHFGVAQDTSFQLVHVTILSKIPFKLRFRDEGASDAVPGGGGPSLSIVYYTPPEQKLQESGGAGHLKVKRNICRKRGDMVVYHQQALYAHFVRRGWDIWKK